MIVKIPDEYLEALYQSKKAKGKPKFNSEVVTRFIQTVNKLKHAKSLAELKPFKSLNLEALKGNLLGKYSVRVNDKYRLIFHMEKEEMVLEEVIVIEELSNHYQ
jgi:proteic killer suppression protein